MELAKQGDVIQGGEWDGFEVISTYSRAQAIEDGVLIDITDWAKEYGIKFPVACTLEVWEGFVNNAKGMECAGQSARGRGLDLVAMLAMAIRLGRGGSEIRFWTIFATHLYRKNGELREARKRVFFKAVCGPGDDMEPVITIMMPNQD